MAAGVLGWQTEVKRNGLGVFEANATWHRGASQQLGKLTVAIIRDASVDG